MRLRLLRDCTLITSNNMKPAEIIKCGCCGDTAEASECLFDPELNVPTCPACTQAGIVAKIHPSTTTPNIKPTDH